MDMAPDAAPIGKDLKALVIEILDDNRTMAVATLRPDGWPQVTMVGYVHDDLTLFFVVARDSQKLTNLQNDPRVSIAIGHHGDQDMAVRGLSMAARVEEVTEPDEIKRLTSLIWRRYPNIAVFAPREVNCAVLRIRPQLISVVDDTRGLAMPETFEVSAQSDLQVASAGHLMSVLGRRGDQADPLEQDIRLDEELWATRVLPEGLLERWLVEDGARVEAGATVAELLIEGARVGVAAPVSGHLDVLTATNAIVEPGSIIGRMRI